MKKPKISFTIPEGKTIYTDLLNLSDPITLSVTPKMYNNDSVDLYFKITASEPDWTFNETEIGLIAAGAFLNKNVNGFGSRAKPSAETIEALHFTLKGYVDAAYTTLKWTYERDISIQLLKSDDGTWTLDQNWNFDDGATAGWSGSGTCNVQSDYVLSSPYSLRNRTAAGGVAGSYSAYFTKTFTTPNKDTAFLIYNFRVSSASGRHPKYIYIYYGTTYLIYIGRTYVAAVGTEIPVDKWVRIMVPLPKGISQTFRIVVYGYQEAAPALFDMHIDDVQVISK